MRNTVPGGMGLGEVCQKRLGSGIQPIGDCSSAGEATHSLSFLISRWPPAYPTGSALKFVTPKATQVASLPALTPFVTPRNPIQTGRGRDHPPRTAITTAMATATARKAKVMRSFNERSHPPTAHITSNRPELPSTSAANPASSKPRWLAAVW